MMGDQRRSIELLASPEEVISIYRKHGTISSLHAAEAIWKAWRLHGRTTGDAVYDFDCLLGAIFEAGRVQGIREERFRRKEGHRPELRSGRAAEKC